MRLLSLTVRNYRIHKDITINFDPFRNLIGGPNESGKSTLAEAAHRALFLRAKTGGNVQKKMVSAHLGGEPEVLLGFEAAGSRWELEKRFAGPARGSTRLTARNGVTLRDDEAEAKLAELLQTSTAGGHGAAGQLSGLWAHLWVWQGKSGDDPSVHTMEHKAQIIRHLQKDGIAAVLQSTADQRVAERIAATYSELFTSTGKVKAGSKPDLAGKRLEEADTAREQARSAASRLAQAADDHARAEREIAEINSTLPKLQADLAATDARLQQAADLRRKEEPLRLKAEATRARRSEIQHHDRTIRELQAGLAEQMEARRGDDEKLAALAEVEAAARIARQTADIAHREAVKSVRSAQIRLDLANASIAAFEKAESHRRLEERAVEAATVRDEIAARRSDLVRLPVVDSKTLARLRKLETEAAQAQAALEAMATGIELVDSPVPVLLDGETLPPGKPSIITEVGELVIGDGTRLRIRPGGGNSLAATRKQAEAADDALTSLLQTHSLRDLDHATTVLEQRRSLEQHITGLDARWKSFGGDSLAAELAGAAARLESAREELTRRIESASSIGETSVPADISAAREFVSEAGAARTAAEAVENSARPTAEYHQEKLEAAAAALSHHRDQTAAARLAIRDIETTIRAREEAHGDESARAAAIAAVLAEESASIAAVAAVHKELADLNPDRLAADRDRFARALKAQEDRLPDAQKLRIIARERLTLDGSTDPDAELRNAEARYQAAHGNHDSEQRRARAVETLHKLFTSSAEAIDRALVQPLAERVSGYLQALFGPGTEAVVQLSDTGSERLSLVRPGDSAFSFDTLSGGAREQAAAAVRLALAEILAGDHDGCLPVIFDDAFAYSDPERIQALQRMLDLAAVRGLQIIVLTCTPADYVSLGAQIVRLP